MDGTNGMSSDNHSITSSLKEMLKIPSSHSTVDQENVSGAGDGINDNATTHRMEPDIVSLETVTLKPADNNENLYQTIALGSVEDGTSVKLSSYESRIIANIDTEIDRLPSASNKIQFKTITKFEWDHQYYLGNLVSVTNKFTAYCVKGRNGNSVRVINRQNASDRILLKGFAGPITDVAFTHFHSNLLAAVDSFANLIVWTLSESNGKIRADKKLHLEAEQLVKNDATPRIVWIPSDHDNPQNSEGSDEELKLDPPDFGATGIMALFFNNTAEVWDMNSAFEIMKEYDGAAKLTRTELRQAFLTVENPDGEITDCELSPFGNVLAAASSDGYVKFWQVQVDQQETPQCLHEWQPHDGRPVSAVRFCDELNQSEPRVYWRFLLTGCDRNIELKMWCAVSWRCLQVIHFQASTPEYSIPELNLTFLRSANFLVLSDIHRKVLYVMRVDADLKEEKASVTQLAYYPLTFPILSQAFITVQDCKFNSHLNGGDDKETETVDYYSDPDESKSQDEGTSFLYEQSDGLLVKLLIIQRRSLQSLDIPFLPIGSDVSLLNNESLNKSKTSLEPSLIQVDDSSTDEDESKTTAASLLGAGDSVASSTKLDFSKDFNEKDETRSNPTPEKVAVNCGPPSNTSDTKDDPPPSTPPVLLTPDAFMGSGMNSDKNSEAASASLLSSVNDISMDSSKEVQKNPLAKLFDQSLTDKSLLREDLTKTPPSSPVVPYSLPSSSHQTPSVDELLQSFQSNIARSSVKSPDLISSAAGSDDVRHEPVSVSTISAPPGLPSRPLNSASPFSSIESPNIFSSLLVPIGGAANTAAWPKAPDVTMSHLLPVSSSTPTSIAGHVLIPTDTPIVSQTPTTDSSSLSDSFNVFRQQQERLLKDHKQKLDVMANRQKQFQKQCESMWKKAEQHGDRVEKAVTSIGQSQLQLSNDVKVGQSTVTDSMVAKIDRSVKSEMKRTVLPGVTSSIAEIRDKLSSSVAQQLSATDSVLKETVLKSLKSKDMTDKVSFEVAKLLQDRIQTILPDIFLQTLIPAFERSCQVMFQQLSSTYHKGLEEMTKQLEKQMQFRLKTEYDKLAQVTKEANDAVRQVQLSSKQLRSEISNNVEKQISQKVDSCFKNLEDRLMSRLLLSMQQQKDQQFQDQSRMIQDSVKRIVTQVMDEKLASSTVNPASSGPLSSMQLDGAPLLRQNSVMSQQEQILKMLQQGKVNEAFQGALNASNLDLVVFVCETTEPSLIFNVTPCPLGQPILLSLIQQLSSELGSKTDLKLKYLQEAVMNLDHSHPVTKEFMSSVLGTLVQNINAASRIPNQPLSKQLKMLGMAAQSLMG